MGLAPRQRIRPHCRHCRCLQLLDCVRQNHFYTRPLSFLLLLLLTSLRCGVRDHGHSWVGGCRQARRMHAVREHLAAASTDAFRLVLAQCKRKQSIDNSGKRHTRIITTTVLSATLFPRRSRALGCWFKPWGVGAGANAVRDTRSRGGEKEKEGEDERKKRGKPYQKSAGALYHKPLNPEGVRANKSCPRSRI